MRAQNPSILLTRPLAQAQRFSQTLRAGPATDVPIFVSPVLKIEMTRPAIDISAYSYLAFTSENGVRAVADQARGDQMAFCVGSRTAHCATKAGFNTLTASGDGPSLARLIADYAPQSPILHLRGAQVRFNLAKAFADGACQIDEVCAYSQIYCDLTPQARALLARPQPVILPLFSPQSAVNFVKSAPKIYAELHIVALSDAVATPARQLKPARLVVSGVASGEEMLKSIAGLLDA